MRSLHRERLPNTADATDFIYVTYNRVKATQRNSDNSSRKCQGMQTNIQTAFAIAPSNCTMPGIRITPEIPYS